jgi:hypothetical protein
LLVPAQSITISEAHQDHNPTPTNAALIPIPGLTAKLNAEPPSACFVMVWISVQATQAMIPPRAMWESPRASPCLPNAISTPRSATPATIWPSGLSYPERLTSPSVCQATGRKARLRRSRTKRADQPCVGKQSQFLSFKLLLEDKPLVQQASEMLALQVRCPRLSNIPFLDQWILPTSSRLAGKVANG